MDSNILAIVLASMSFVGTIAVALLSRQTAHQTEQLKYQLQRDQTRFASTHSKQVEVLSRLFQLCMQAKASYDVTRIAWNLKEHITRYSNLEAPEILFEYLQQYVSSSTDATKDLEHTNKELSTYLNENLVFIDDAHLETKLFDFTSLISLIPTYNNVLKFWLDNGNHKHEELNLKYTTSISTDYIRSHFETLDRTHKRLIESIPQILEEIKHHTRISITGDQSRVY